MTKILVTGGAGYIGSHTILQLLRGNPSLDIVVFDNLKNGNREALERITTHTGKPITLIEADLLEPGKIDAALAEHKVDAVIHFAALIEAGVSMVHPTKFFENNIAGSINLVKAMQTHGVKKLVFSSTAAVYGTPESPEVYETTAMHPENWYGFSKFAVEQLLQALTGEHAAETERIDTVILRYFNAAGADPEGVLGQAYPNPTHLITLAIQAALGVRDKLLLFGKDYPTKDGTCVRDYIHVKDLAEAHVKALNYLQDFSGSEIINVGTGTGTTNLEVVKLLTEIHGEFKWEFAEPRPGDPVAFFANNEKAQQLLNWKPEYTVKDAIQHAYNWQKSNPNGYKHS